VKLTSPATARNRDPIAAVLREVLPERGLVLEVASGAGEHAVHFNRADAMLCIHMVHISPWAACVGLMRGAGRLLDAGSPLILYGPYRRAGVETAPSNEAFDRSLQSRNPLWGLRDVDDVVAEALRNGLALERVVEMPANNLILVFRKQ
jgi:hypothetical protein